MPDEASTAERYARFADHEAAGSSAIYEEWSREIAIDPEVIGLLGELPTTRRQPNLLYAAMRFEGCAAGPWGDARDWLLGNWSAVSTTMRTRTNQMNEAGRCGALVPALALLPQPVALIEVGCSAGLCLRPDLYAYSWGGQQRGTSDLIVEMAIRGPVPVPDRLPRIAARIGIDLNPHDIADADTMRWLDALIWPEHETRRKRLRRAAELAADAPADIRAGDLNELLEPALRDVPRGATPVVFHSAVLGYLGHGARQRFVDQVAATQAHWISNEFPGVSPGVPDTGVTKPDGTHDGFTLAVDGTPVALADPHGEWLVWMDG